MTALRALLLALLLGLAFAPTALHAELSQLERETIRQDAEVAGQAKFCRMDWRPLYRAVIESWRASGRAVEDVQEVDRIFQGVMKAQSEILSKDFCTMGQIQVDYSMERALRFYGADPAAGETDRSIAARRPAPQQRELPAAIGPGHGGIEGVVAAARQTAQMTVREARGQQDRQSGARHLGAQCPRLRQQSAGPVGKPHGDRGQFRRASPFEQIGQGHPLLRHQIGGQEAASDTGIVRDRSQMAGQRPGSADAFPGAARGRAADTEYGQSKIVEPAGAVPRIGLEGL
ncbi:MAG: hypothetical protein O3A96_11850, partial [Proteobacteria bacterium]|nr:hypothetical protein [Pseudomonadota bacterium]